MDRWMVLWMAVFLEGWMGFGMDGFVSGLDGWILMYWIYECMDGWKDGCTVRLFDGWVDGWVGRVSGCVDGF